MRTKKNFILRKMRDYYLVVSVGPASKEFNGMLRLNEASAFLWRELEKGASEEELIEAMLARCPKADRAAVAEDVRDFLEKMKIAIDDEGEKS